MWPSSPKGAVGGEGSVAGARPETEAGRVEEEVIRGALMDGEKARLAAAMGSVKRPAPQRPHGSAKSRWPVIVVGAGAEND